MAARTPLPAKSNDSDSSLVTGLIFTVLVLVAALIVGGYWMQKQRGESAERMQANAYQNYLNNTRPTPMPPAAQASAVRSQQAQAQETRQYLLGHPAVTPGPGFDKPGVQTTGKTIVQAIDQAKGL